MANREFFQVVKFKGGGWFRMFGKGLAWKDTTQHRPLFSERNGYAKCATVGRWMLTWLS